MNRLRHPTNRLLRTAAWFYIAPRAVTLLLIIAAIGLAAFLIFLPMALTFLQSAAR